MTWQIFWLHVLPYTKLFFSFLSGMLGSGAYVTAIYFKFIGINDDYRNIVLAPFRKFNSKEVSLLKCVWYSAIGGFVAVIFQVDVPNFVAVQSLILGATWPAVISNFLSGRMTTPSREEIQDLEKSQDVPFEEEIKQKLVQIESKISVAGQTSTSKKK